MIFLDFLKVKKNYENMLQNAPNCTIPNKFSGKHAPKPPYQTHGYATRRKPPTPPNKNSWPPLANPAYAHELLKNLFENPPWQTVDCACSTLYVYALQNLFRGQKMTKMVAQHILKCITWALFSNTMCP